MLRPLLLATGFILAAGPVMAADSYSADLTQKFIGWCTTTQGQPQTVCSCALDKAMQSIPSSAMASFVGGGTATASATQGVGAAALQIVAACAAGGASTGGSSGSSTGSLMNSLSGALGKH